MAYTCRWKGASDKEYIYIINSIKDSALDDVPGNYIFARESEPNKWEALYIGETESFKDLIPNHNELTCIRRNKCTHVHTHTNLTNQARLAEEKDLLANHTTPCND